MLKVYLLKVILIECKLLNRSLTFFTVSLTFHKISESYDGLNHSWIFSKIVAKLTNIFGEHESSIEHYPTSFVRRKHSIQNDAKIFFFKLFANIFVRTKSIASRTRLSCRRYHCIVAANTHATLLGEEPGTSSEVPHERVAGVDGVGGVVEAMRTTSEGLTIPDSRATLRDVRRLSPVTIRVRMLASRNFFNDSKRI